MRGQTGEEVEERSEKLCERGRKVLEELFNASRRIVIG